MTRAAIRRTYDAPLAESEAPASTSGEKWGLAVAIGGFALTVVGLGLVVAYGRKKGSQLGEIQKTVEAGGMRMDLHYHPVMPIAQRVALVQKKTFESVMDPRMRKIALNVTHRCPARDGRCEAGAVGDFVYKNVRYTGDIAPIKLPNGQVEGIDLFQSAFRTVEFRGGDCDDHSIAVATLLSLNGIPSKFRITKPRPGADWGHIYTLAGLPKENPTQWVPMDTTLPNYTLGLEHPHAEHVDFVV